MEGFNERKSNAQCICVLMPEWSCVCSYFLYVVACFDMSCSELRMKTGSSIWGGNPRVLNSLLTGLLRGRSVRRIYQTQWFTHNIYNCISLKVICMHCILSAYIVYYYEFTPHYVTREKLQWHNWRYYVGAMLVLANTRCMLHICFYIQCRQPSVHINWFCPISSCS